jgi:hypothetical protein
VDSVREARKNGIEAYFYHGEVTGTSSVCIGCWPREAVKEQDSAVAESRDSEQPILVTDQPLPRSMGTNLMDRDGKHVKALTPRIEPVDPTLIAAMKQYPYHQINGMEVIRRGKDRNTGKTVEAPEQSFLVLVPQPGEGKGQVAATAGMQSTPGQTQQPNQQYQEQQPQSAQGANAVQAPRRSTKGTGKLRSLEE